MNTFYEELLTKTADSRHRLFSNKLIVRAVQGDISAQEYYNFLGQAYHHVRHTVPLLMLAGSKSADAYPGLQSYFAAYIQEEIGHESWIRWDMDAVAEKYINIDTGYIAPSTATEVMVAYAYDIINRVNPLGFLGMVLVLEGTSTEFATLAANTIASSLNLPPNAFTYLSSHGSLDVGHTEFYRDLVNKIANKEHQDLVVHAANMFYKLYSDIFTELDSRE